jgi:hypothetical protein
MILVLQTRTGRHCVVTNYSIPSQKQSTPRKEVLTLTNTNWNTTVHEMLICSHLAADNTW